VCESVKEIYRFGGIEREIKEERGVDVAKREREIRREGERLKWRKRERG
jgi:hypothetical protein